LSEYPGHENLELLSQCHRFNSWIYEQIRPGLWGDILEIGSATGTFSEKVIYDFSPNSHITLTDISMSYIKKLEERFILPGTGIYNKPYKNICVRKLDLNSPKDYELIGHGKYDSIMAINVFEHVQNDEFALNQLYEMLKGTGRLILLVPCYKFLYNVIDREIGHVRRYTKKELETKITKTKFFHWNQIS
jgi:SAM-dependent methyltransferase